MTEEKWMTFDELPDGLCIYKERDNPPPLRLKSNGKLYHCADGEEQVHADGERYRPIDPKAIEVGELFLRWAEQAMSHLNPEIKVSNHMITVCGHDASNNPKDAFRDFFERMKPKEPETTLADISEGKFGVAVSGVYFRAPFALLSRRTEGVWDVGPWAEGELCTIHDTLDDAEAAAKEARQ